MDSKKDIKPLTKKKPKKVVAKKSKKTLKKPNKPNKPKKVVKKKVVQTQKVVQNVRVIVGEIRQRRRRLHSLLPKQKPSSAVPSITTITHIHHLDSLKPQTTTHPSDSLTPSIRVPQTVEPVANVDTVASEPVVALEPVATLEPVAELTRDLTGLSLSSKTPVPDPTPSRSFSVPAPAPSLSLPVPTPTPSLTVPVATREASLEGGDSDATVLLRRDSTTPHVVTQTYGEDLEGESDATMDLETPSEKPVDYLTSGESSHAGKKSEERPDSLEGNEKATAMPPDPQDPEMSLVSTEAKEVERGGHKTRSKAPLFTVSGKRVNGSGKKYDWTPHRPLIKEYIEKYRVSAPTSGKEQKFKMVYTVDGEKTEEFIELLKLTGQSEASLKSRITASMKAPLLANKKLKEKSFVFPYNK